MVEKIFEDILEGREARQNLSKLRAEIKQRFEREKVEDLIEQDNYLKLVALLDHEDAKTRKNAALFMGDMEMDSLFMEPVFRAYEREEQLFVRSSYLSALKNSAYERFLPEMKARLSDLQKMELTEENKKHLLEEQKLLSELILQKEGRILHKFTGYNEKSEIVLLTNRNHIEVVKKQVEELVDLDSRTLKTFSAGLILKTDALDRIKDLRTYSELLFRVNGMKTCDLDPVKAAETIAASDLMNFLMKRHEGGAPFYFRVERKGKLVLDEKAKFVKKLSQELELKTSRKLVNSTSHYEIEIRLVENKSEQFNVFVKLHTLPDERFSYRKEVIAASIKPVNAALLVQLAKDYMVEDAQVLDPFCGVGTMLIERQMVVKGNTSYGIDLYNEGIEKARINTKKAGQIIHFVNKDMFDFTHEYRFDEIFTNMPFAAGNVSENEIVGIYTRFFQKARTLLTDQGTIIMYTHNREFIGTNAAKAGFRVAEKFEVNRREGTDLYILTRA